MNRQEVWESVVDALEEKFLRTEFEKGEFEVHVNRGMRTITIVHRPTNQVMAFMDVSYSHLEGGTENSKLKVVFDR